jgi:hypothetical protein
VFRLKRKKVTLTLLALIALALSAVNVSNQQKELLSTTYASPSTALPSPTPEPTTVATTTPPEPTVSFTLWHTNSPVLQPPADQLAHVPPICEIESPENQTVLQTNNFTLNVNVASYFWIINSVYYEADWIEGIHQIFGVQPNGIDALNASITVNFSEIPDGNHTLTVYANTHDGSHSFATVIFRNAMYSPKLTKSGPFPTSAILVILAIVILAVTPSLLLYRRHRKNNSNPPISKIFKYTTNCEFGVS